MSDTPQLAGLHHVSALSAHIARSRDFYVRVLGLRPLVTTVNQDDPSMYHLLFGDGAGTPGSEMTVFDLPRAAPERRGTSRVARTTFRVAGADAVAYWADRLATLGVAHTGVAERDGRAVLDLDDPEGTPLALVDDGGAGAAHPWDASPVPAARQIRGLGPIMLTVPALAPTERFLTGPLALRHERAYALAGVGAADTHVYAMGDGGPAAEVHVTVQPELARTRYGAGGVHHLALRVPDGQRLDDWLARLDAAGHANSGLVDRHWFRSLYVREPNGILFELATDGPGFAVDGPPDGDRLTLPPHLEPRRAEIEAHLTPLVPAAAVPAAAS